MTMLSRPTNAGPSSFPAAAAVGTSVLATISAATGTALPLSVNGVVVGVFGPVGIIGFGVTVALAEEVVYYDSDYTEYSIEDSDQISSQLSYDDYILA